MPRFDEHSAQCHVLTFRDGALSALGHDLKLAVSRFVITTSQDATRIEGTFDARSIGVVAALRGKAEDRGALTEDDRRSIDAVVATDVLRVDQHPEIVFRSIEVSHLDSGVHVDGEVTLLGRRKRVGFVVQRAGDFLWAEVVLYQPDFGITPYSALLGTLKIKPHVTVRVLLPAR